MFWRACVVGYVGSCWICWELIIILFTYHPNFDGVIMQAFSVFQRQWSYTTMWMLKCLLVMGQSLKLGFEMSVHTNLGIYLKLVKAMKYQIFYFAL
jgi:hypothetical protein